MKKLKILQLNNQSGSLLVELLIAIGLGSLLLPTLIGSIMVAREGKSQQKQRTQAVMLVREAEEAVRSVRENGWEGISTNGTFHPEISSGQWVLSANSETVFGFTRQIVISSVERNETGDIVNSGGTVDPSTKKIVISVTWGTPLPSSADSVMYITRHDNMPYPETTEEDFVGGTSTGVTVTNTEGGEVILGSGGSGDWCSPSESTVATENLPGQGVATAISAVEGKALLGTGSNASGISYGKITLSNDNPPDPNLDPSDQFSGYKTNDIYAFSDYAYLATDTNGRQGVIVSTVDDQPKAYLDSGSGSVNGNSIFATDTHAFLLGSNKLYIYDTAVKSGTKSSIANITLAGTGTKGRIVGDYAYISISGSATKMQIVNLANPSSPQIVANSIFSAGNAVDVHVNETGTRAYIATALSATNNEFFIINTTTKSGTLPSPIGSYNSGDMNPRGVIAVPGNRAIIVGHGGAQYQVINISNEANPVLCGERTFTYQINGVSAVVEPDGDAYSYILTDDADLEFQVIEGGPGGGFSSYGEFESETYTLGRSIVFNRVFLNYLQPNQTTVRVRTAVTTPASGNCADAVFRFVGPNGTTESDDFFTADAAIPVIDDGLGYANPGLCFRYKVYLETLDSSTTPIFYDITINHSP